jgi:hypothetical protein
MLRVDLIDIPGSTRHLNVEAMMSRLPNRFDWRPKWVLGRHFPWELLEDAAWFPLSIGLAMAPKNREGKPAGKAGYISNYDNNLATRLRDVNAS